MLGALIRYGWLVAAVAVLGIAAVNDAVAASEQAGTRLTSLDKIDRSLAAGAIDPEQATLLRVHSVVRPSQLPAEFRPDVTELERCGTEVLRQAWLARDEFSPRGQLLLAAALARPSTSASFDSPDGYFRIHYSTTGSHAVPGGDSDGDSVPDYVENVADYADSSHRQEVLQYGFLAPPSDGGSGGSSAYDIYCQSIGAYGYAVPENPGPAPWNDWSSYVVIHNNFFGFPPNTDPDGDQLGAAKVTIAHEFGHSCQFSHDAGENGWFMEQCATWLEDEVFDQTNDNYNYLSGFFPVPYIALYSSSGLHEYASFVWPTWICENFGYQAMVDIWNECITTQALNAIDNALSAGYSSSLTDAFGGFITWNWITSSRDDGAHYVEAANYHAISIMRSHNSYPVAPQSSSQAMAALSSNYIRFLPPAGGSGRPVMFRFDGNDAYEWTVRIAAKPIGGPFEEYEMTLDGQAAGQFALTGFDDYDHVAMIPGVTSTVGNNLNYTYSACLGPQAPGLVGPEEGATASTPVGLEWEATAGALSYRLQLDDDPAFGTPDVDTSLTGFTYSAEGLTEGAVYYWRVTVTDACAESGFSETRSFRAACGIAMTGDVDESGDLNSADVIYLVNYVFKGGLEPLPISQSGDVDCSGGVVSADIIYMVTHVFKSGQEPCDVCAIL